MKVKILFITMLFFMQVQLFSQCISIELSVTWQMGHDIFNKDSVISVPILNITYRNDCDANYYFFKVSPRKDGENMVLCLALRSSSNYNKLEIAKLHANYANENYNVQIGGRPWYNMGWEIIEDTFEYYLNNPNKFPPSCSLEDIYDYLYSENCYGVKKAQHGYFKPSILTPENILSGTVTDQFAFLKPNENHVDTYNLIGYKKIEGCYTFYIGQDEIKKYVLGTDSIEIELPSVVGDYQLYSGKFNTNKVTVCFGEE